MEAAPHFEIRGASLLPLPLVVEFLAPGKGDLDLHPPVAKIGPEGDDRKPFQGAVSEELFYLALVQQELPRPFRVEGSCLGEVIRSYVTVA